jgi:hypothetical protein
MKRPLWISKILLIESRLRVLSYICASIIEQMTKDSTKRGESKTMENDSWAVVGQSHNLPQETGNGQRVQDRGT